MLHLQAVMPFLFFLAKLFDYFKHLSYFTISNIAIKFSIDLVKIR